MTYLQSLLNPNSISAPNLSGNKSAFLVLSHRHLPSSLRYGALRPHTVDCFLQCSVPPKGLGSRFRGLECRRRKQSVVSFAASREEPKHSDIEIEKEKNELKEEAEESEAWKQALETFKEQSIKMQGMSQEAYEVYSKKAMEILMKTSEQLKIEADKARDDLAKLAKEMREGGKEYLSTATKDYPKPVKDIIDTFSFAEFKEISEVRDFYLGIPYGALLSIGGFLSFMLTGSISAVRFGVILGGALLALSMSSLRSWKQRESSAPFLKGQAAVAVIIFIREISLQSLRPSFSAFIKALVSGAMVLFYAYRIVLNGQNKSPTLEGGSEN